MHEWYRTSVGTNRQGRWQLQLWLIAKVSAHARVAKETADPSRTAALTREQLRRGVAWRNSCRTYGRCRDERGDWLSRLPLTTLTCLHISSDTRCTLAADHGHGCRGAAAADRVHRSRGCSSSAHVAVQQQQADKEVPDTRTHTCQEGRLELAALA